jgi:GT2 family glycosyltransferase
VHVVVVAYHAANALDRALTALGGALPVTVVDNSQSDAVRAVADEHAATYVPMLRNAGFAAGVNEALGLLQATQQDVLLLNPDAVVSADEVAELAAFLSSDDSIAAVAPQLVDESRSPQQTLWPLPSPLNAWLVALGLGRFQRGACFAVGAVLLLRWEAIADVGFFDERYFLYAEEADWQRRAIELGWRSALYPDVSTVHSGAGTSTDPIRREMLFHAAHETYMRKWHGVSGWHVYRAAAVVGAAIRVAILSDARRDEARRRLQLYTRGPCRVLAAEPPADVRLRRA